MIAGRHDDHLADAIAITQAVRDERTGDVAVILRHCNLYAVCITLGKLLGEVADECGAAPEALRFWAAKAIERGRKE